MSMSDSDRRVIKDLLELLIEIELINSKLV